MLEWYPVAILATGIAIVIGLILLLKINAFFALITGAIVVSLMADGPAVDKVSRVAKAFGDSAAGIGIVIALAAVIGKCLMDSGAADRIVRSLTRMLGEERAPIALMGSGYILSVPVFFDTVFYLMVPLARSLWQQKRKNYVLYTTSIVAGGAVTHTMVPPTPGPLAIATNLNIDLGFMMIAGSTIGLCMSLIGLAYCWLLNRWLDIPMRPYAGDVESKPLKDEALPPLLSSLLPVVLPVLLIGLNTACLALSKTSPEQWENSLAVTGILGNPNLALLISAAISIYLVIRYRGRSLSEMSDSIEQSLMSGGVVILITAAGGAFGKMLAAGGIDQTVKALIGDSSSSSGFAILWAAFLVAVLLKFAQGSGTVSMLTTSAMFGAMGFTSQQLGFNIIYLAMAIGSGSLIGDWMNNSGFWVFAKMSVLTTTETLKTWSSLTAVMGLTGFFVTLVGAYFLPGL